MKENYETMVDNIEKNPYLQEIVFKWLTMMSIHGKKPLKRQAYKEVILQWTEQSPLMTMMWTFKKLLKGPFTLREN